MLVIVVGVVEIFTGAACAEKVVLGGVVVVVLVGVIDLTVLVAALVGTATFCKLVLAVLGTAIFMPPPDWAN